MGTEYLSKLEDKSLFIIREAKAQFKNTAALWSIGKDSTVLLWLCKKAFLGRIPFAVVHIDTGLKFPEMYKFRDKLVKKWGINFIIASNSKALNKGMSPQQGNRFACCMKLKTDALKQCLKKHNFDALLLAIRRDEHGIRAKERYFSPRDKAFRWDYTNQPPEFWDLYKANFQGQAHHYRIHPLLHWTELDIWRYIKAENIPVNPLYFSKRGRRFRSLGCMPCTVPVDSRASNVDEIIKELMNTSTPERIGRTQDKERAYMMQKLRSLGYM